MLDGDLVDVEDARVSARRDLAMLFDRLEDLPPVPAIFVVARQPVRDEERLDCLWAIYITRVEGRRHARSIGGTC